MSVFQLKSPYISDIVRDRARVTDVGIGNTVSALKTTMICMPLCTVGEKSLMILAVVTTSQ